MTQGAIAYWRINRKSYVVYRTAARRHFQWPWTTPYPRFQGHAILLCWISHKRYEIHSFNRIL